MVSIQPQLWVDRGATAVSFYRTAFGATVLHLVGEDEEVVAQLDVNGSAFWVATTGSLPGRLTPRAAGGATGRILLVVDDPDATLSTAMAAGAIPVSPVADGHGWRVGRILDPFGHEWEIGRPTGTWPPPGTEAHPAGA